MNKENKELIDNAFYMEEKQWGTWDSYDKDGKCIVTSLTKESCLNATRFMLKLKQENKLNEVGVTYDGSVSGKL